jgi:hypothetical protein
MCMGNTLRVRAAPSLGKWEEFLDASVLTRLLVARLSCARLNAAF